MKDLIINHYPWNYAQLWTTPVRYNVFIREQRVPLEEEFDEIDLVSTHFIAFSGNQPVATARLTPNHHVGRVAVQAPWRGQGIGLEVMNAVIALTKQRDLHLLAQTSAMGFYERLGFTSHGSTLIEAGIEHIKMVRQGRRKAA